MTDYVYLFAHNFIRYQINYVRDIFTMSTLYASIKHVVNIFTISVLKVFIVYVLIFIYSVCSCMCLLFVLISNFVRKFCTLAFLAKRFVQRNLENNLTLFGQTQTVVIFLIKQKIIKRLNKNIFMMHEYNFRLLFCFVLFFFSLYDNLTSTLTIAVSFLLHSDNNPPNMLSLED